MSSQLDINSLFESTNQKTLRRLETYDNILKKCHARIKYYSKFEKTTCFFAIPEFLIGVPLYDVNESKYKPIEEYKPSGSFIYDQSAMSSLEEKTKKILQVNTLNI